MTTAPTASQVAKGLALTQLKELAAKAFPDITNLREAQYTNGALRAPDTELTGTWHGVTLQITPSMGATSTHVWVRLTQRCRCCNLYVTTFGPSVNDVSGYARQVQTDPTQEIDFCFGCQWLHAEAQPDAVKAKSRLRKWWVAKSRGHSVDELLAAHGPNRDGAPVAAPAPAKAQRTRHAGPFA